MTRNIYLEDIPLEEARNRLEMTLKAANRFVPLNGELVSLKDTLGRVTAEPVWAKISSPHYHASAMDGYAVLAEHTRNATETRPLGLIIGERVFPVNTGDPLPPNTNAVIMIEDVQHLDGNRIEIRASVAPWRHVRMMGEDMVATEFVLPANHEIRPVDLGAIAGCGHHEVMVRRQPKVIIIPTGDELVSVGVAPQRGQIIEYNSLVIQAQCVRAGSEVNVTEIIPDDKAQIHSAIVQAVQTNPDLLLVLSGSSAGSKDFTASVIQELGELLVHGIAVRPGHPVIIGMVKDIPVIGIPGYPVSAALTGEFFVLPILKQWTGKQQKARPQIQATITRKLLSPIGDDDYVRVTLAQVGDRLLATPLNRGAGVITSLVRADGLAHIPRFTEGVDMGQSVIVDLLRPIHVIQQTVQTMGSHDPMLDLLGQYISTKFPSVRLTSANVGSLGGLVALRRKEAHVAGIHLLDPDTGEYNVSYIRQHLPDEPLKLVTFVHREQGFIVPSGNPHNIQSFDDLTRVNFVNRQRGAGTRVLLDYELGQHGIPTEHIQGYDHEEYTHLAVAAAVASGVADCGLGVRNAAIALGLDFVPVAWERYDLVIPSAYDENEGIHCLLTLLNDDEFQYELSQPAGYDSRETGKIQYEQ